MRIIFTHFHYFLIFGGIVFVAGIILGGYSVEYLYWLKKERERRLQPIKNDDPITKDDIPLADDEVFEDDPVVLQVLEQNQTKNAQLN